GRNAERFAADFADWKEIRIPKIHWEYTTRRVLTMEDIGAIKISDTAAYAAQGVPASDIAQLLFKFYLEQVFVNGFFHADPHSGNLFVEPHVVDGEVKFTLNVVDFGMVGSISPQLKATLRDGFIGVVTRDVHRLIQVADAAGWLLPSANRREIERAADKLFARFWGMSMRDVQNLDLDEMRGFLKEFRSLLYQMPFQIPANILFLGRALGILSGLATQIDLRFNVFAAATPYAQQMISDAQGSIFTAIRDQAIEVGKALLQLPGKMDRMLDIMVRGETRVVVADTDRLIKEFSRMNRAMTRLQWTIIFMGFVLGAIVLEINNRHEMSPLVFVAAIIAWVWLTLRSLR
ncbi:MAG TPA: AarF/UbiB family protein, partial [Anaerolineae bacterium]